MQNIAEIIRQERERRNLTLEQVSDAIKVSVSFLKNIEEGKFDFQAPVYVKAFVKSYLKFLNLDSPELLEEVDKILGIKKIPIAVIEEESEEEEKDSTIYFKHKWFEYQNIINYVVYFIIACGILLIFYFTIFKPSEKKPIESTRIEKMSEKDTTKEGFTEQLMQNIVPQKDSLILEIKAIDSCWIRAEIDLRRTEEAYLVRGQVKRFSADSVCKFHIGNAANIDIFRNGKLLEEIPKKRASYRNLIITKTQVILPAWLTDTTRAYQKRQVKEEQKKEKPFLLNPSEIERPNPLKKRND